MRAGLRARVLEQLVGTHRLGRAAEDPGGDEVLATADGAVELQYVALAVVALLEAPSVSFVQYLTTSRTAPAMLPSWPASTVWTSTTELSPVISHDASDTQPWFVSAQSVRRRRAEASPGFRLTDARSRCSRAITWAGRSLWSVTLPMNGTRSCSTISR